MPERGLALYTIPAQRAFADSLRADEPDLRVTSVHPGRVDTEMQRELVAYEGGEYDPARFLAPETVAQMVAQVVAILALAGPSDAQILYGSVVGNVTDRKSTRLNSSH